MIGSIIGDTVGSVYETIPVKYKDFNLFHSSSSFTDDSILTIAIADWLLNGGSLVDLFHEYYSKYPGAGWGRTFGKWAKVKDKDPYGSWGNGAAMRVGCIGWACDSLKETERLAEESAIVTHDHIEGILSAKAVAGSIFLARNGASKDEIRKYASEIGKYDLSRCLDEIRPKYKFEVYAIYSVPQAIISFLESENFEDSIRNAVSLGGDADTQACIAGSIAEAFYKDIPYKMARESLLRLDRPLYDIIKKFYEKYCSDRWINVECELIKQDEMNYQTPINPK